MSNERNKWIDAVAKLIKLTQDGQLVWAAQEPPFTFSKRPNFSVEVVFACKYGEKNLRLYEKRIQGEVDEFDEFEIRPVTKVEWTKVTVLEFVDERGNSLWAFPKIEALNDLFSTVQYQVAGVRDFLAELLAS